MAGFFFSEIPKFSQKNLKSMNPNNNQVNFLSKQLNKNVQNANFKKS
jgi:hypothetical protein